MISGSEILTDLHVTLFQLIELGLCKYAELKDGSLTFRDIILLLEYAGLKNNFVTWRRQHEELRRKQVN